jgi:hypothetical protein
MFACVCAAALSCGPCALSGFGPESPGAFRLASVLVNVLPVSDRTKGRLLFHLVRPGLTKAQVRAAFSTCTKCQVFTSGGLWDTNVYSKYGVRVGFDFPAEVAVWISWEATDGTEMKKKAANRP